MSSIDVKTGRSEKAVKLNQLNQKLKIMNNPISGSSSANYSRTSQAQFRLRAFMASRAGRFVAFLILGIVTLSQSARALPSYVQTVLASQPRAFWQLNETNNPSNGTLPAADSTGNGFNGTYGTDTQTAFNGWAGPQNPPYAGFPNTEGAAVIQPGDLNSPITLPPLNFNTSPTKITTNGVTIAIWINPNANQATYTGLLMNRNSGGDAAGFGFGGTENASGMPGLGYTWNNNAQATWSWSSGVYPVAGVWQLAVLVISSNSATVYLDYVDPGTGQPVLQSAVNPIAHTAEPFSTGGFYLGSDSAQNGGAANAPFSGSIADAAVYNTALTANQVVQLFAAGVGVAGFAPSITGQPQSQYVIAGSPATFSATGINGTATIGYQWQLNGTNINALVDATNFAGAFSNVLTVSNATTLDVGTYVLVATNSIGTTDSGNALLTIQAPALVGEWLNGASTNLNDESGYSLAPAHSLMSIGGNNYVFTNDVPPGQSGVSAFFYNGDSGFAVSNSSTMDSSYDNTFDGVIGNAFTVSCWARGWPETWDPWLSKFGETESGWQLRSWGGGPDAAFTVRDNNAGTNTLGGGGDDQQASFASEDGYWHYYVGTYNAATGVRDLYVDGQLAAQEINNNPPYNLAPSAHLCIDGKDTPPGDDYSSFSTNTEVFDARVYNYALTQPQILTYYTNVPAKITGQPANVLAFSAQRVAISAVYQGSPALTFQWQLNGTNVNALADASNFIGATNSNTLTIKSVSSADVGTYSLAINNLYGSDLSSNATLAIVPQVLEGEWFTNGSLKDLSGHTPGGRHDGYDAAGTGGYSFTNDVPPGWSGQSVVLNGTTAIAISNSATSDASYTNTFDDQLLGNMTVAFWAKGFPSGWAYLVTKNGDSGSPNTGWNIRRDGWEPSNNPCWTQRSPTPGGTVTVGAPPTYGDTDDLGSGALNLKDGAWHHYAGTYNKATGVRNLYSDGVLVGQITGAGAYSVASFAHLVVGGFEASPGGTINNFFTGSFYDLRIYNYDLNSNQIAVIAYHPDPLITVQPGSVSTYLGVTANFSVTEKGTAPFTNQWQFNGTNMVDGIYGNTVISGSGTSTLTIAGVTSNNIGSYALVVSNPLGSTLSSNATLSIIGPTVPPPAGNLVGSWFTGAANLTDTSGYSPAGTHDGYGAKGAGVASSGYTFTNDAPYVVGASGSALWLNAGNTGIAISNSCTLDVNYTNTFDDLTNAFTVECWAKGSFGAWNAFVTKGGDSGTGWALRQGGTGGIACWTLRGTGGTDDMQASIVQTLGVWHFYTGTFNVTTGIRNLYVDGVLEAQETNNTAFTDSLSHLTFGTEDLSPGNNFGNNGYITGEIYGVKIYNTELTPAQINNGVVFPGPAVVAPPVFGGKPVLLGGNQLVLTWTGGTLQSSTNVAGPYSPVVGATSPYTNSISGAPQMFYRLSNP